MLFRMTADSPSLRTILLKGLGDGRGMGEFGKRCRGGSEIASGGPAGSASYNAGFEKGGSVENDGGLGAALSTRAGASAGDDGENGSGFELAIGSKENDCITAARATMRANESTFEVSHELDISLKSHPTRSNPIESPKSVTNG
jgi:hypothetical protein